MAYNPLDESLIDYAASIFKALSDPTRIKILHLLNSQACSVNEITKNLNLEQSTVSHQLRYLRQLRLVKNRRVKTKYYYALDDTHVMKLLEQTIAHAKHI